MYSSLVYDILFGLPATPLSPSPLAYTPVDFVIKLYNGGVGKRMQNYVYNNHEVCEDQLTCVPTMSQLKQLVLALIICTSISNTWDWKLFGVLSVLQLVQ